MARRASRGIDSVAYPSGDPKFEILVAKGSQPPQLTDRERRVIHALIMPGYWLLRARLRERRDKTSGERNKKLILSRFPRKFRGFVAGYGKLRFKVLVNEVRGEEVVDPDRFLQHFRDHPKVVKRLVLQPVLFRDPTRYLALVGVLKEVFGEDVTKQVGVEFEPKEYRKAVSEIGQPPAGTMADKDVSWRIDTELL